MNKTDIENVADDDIKPEQPLLHWYSFVFQHTTNVGGLQTQSIYIGFAEPNITMECIQSAKSSCSLPPTCVMLSLSYLGHHTKARMVCGHEKDDITIDWVNLSKRLIGAMHYGIRIENESGHRWIVYDPEADNWPRRAFSDGSVRKVYGSYMEALNVIDAELAKHKYPSLLEEFEGINCYEDLGRIFGEGVQ